VSTFFQPALHSPFLARSFQWSFIDQIRTINKLLSKILNPSYILNSIYKANIQPIKLSLAGWYAVLSSKIWRRVLYTSHPAPGSDDFWTPGTGSPACALLRRSCPGWKAVLIAHADSWSAVTLVCSARQATAAVEGFRSDIALSVSPRPCWCSIPHMPWAARKEQAYVLGVESVTPYFFEGSEECSAQSNAWSQMQWDGSGRRG